MNTEFDNRKSRNDRRILVMAIVILLITNGILLYFLMSDRNVNRENTANRSVAADTEATDREIDSLREELEIHKVALMKLGSDTAVLVSAIQELDTDIQEINKQRQQLEIQKQRVEAKLAENNRRIENKANEERNELKEMNKSLLAEKELLKEQQEKLNNSLDEIMKAHRDLAEKYEKAAVLSTTNHQFAAVNKRGRQRVGIPGATVKQNQIEKILIGFQLEDNKAAAKNNKEIFVRVVAPDGSALHDSDSSGVFQVNGDSLQYTRKKEILFDNSNQEIVVQFAKDDAWQIGEHKVEIYCEGHQIGEESFVVR